MKRDDKFDVKTAILVDGSFYRYRAQAIAGYKTPKDRAAELERYCLDHLHDKYEHRYLYRIFYYDCAPIPKGNNIYHPLLKKSIEIGGSESARWMTSFLDELKHRRKFAVRLGRLGGGSAYNLRPEITKDYIQAVVSIRRKNSRLFIGETYADLQDRKNQRRKSAIPGVRQLQRRDG